VSASAMALPAALAKVMAESKSRRRWLLVVLRIGDSRRPRAMPVDAVPAEDSRGPPREKAEATLLGVDGSAIRGSSMAHELLFFG